MKNKHSGFLKKPFVPIIILIVAVVIVILFFTLKGGNDNSQPDNGSKNYQAVTPSELMDNKEKYENKNVELINVLVPDANFAYIKKTDGSQERLFIEPKKSEFCLNFNLKGTLKKDLKKEWLFFVDEFDCVNN